MLNTKIGQLALYLVPTAFAPSPAIGEMLLIEIHQTGSSIDRNFIGEPIHMSFAAGGRGSDWDLGTRIEGDYTSSDVGMTFSATPERVEIFERWLSASDGLFALDISSFTPTGHEVDELWLSEVGDLSMQQFVSRLGIGLSGYDLTSVTQRVDRIDYSMSGMRIVSEQAQTIRIYGLAVPEPETIILILSAHGLVISVVVNRHRLTRRLID